MNLRIGLFLFLLGLIVTACVTSIDETLPYAALPAITLATDVDLVASPSDPTSIIANARVPAGAKLDIIGRDQDAAWFLVEHENILGWVPSFYSRTNVGTLNTALIFEPLPAGCTKFLGITQQPNATWTSPVDGSLTVVGSIYRPSETDQIDDASLAILIDEPGQAVEGDFVNTPLTASSSAIFFGFRIERLAVGNQIRFQLDGLDGETATFEAAFFADTCDDHSRFTDWLPIGQLKRDITGFSARENVESTMANADPNAGSTTTPCVDSITIRRTSDARTPTPRPTDSSIRSPTPLPTPDIAIYGKPSQVTEAFASSERSARGSVQSSIDQDLNTYWESTANDDIGAWIELQLIRPVKVQGIRFYFPESKYYSGWPKDLSLRFDDGTLQRLQMEAVTGWQYHALSPVETKTVRLEIEEVMRTAYVHTTKFYEIQLFSELEPATKLKTDNPAVAIDLQAGYFDDVGDSGRLRTRFIYSDTEYIDLGALALQRVEQDIAGFWIDAAEPVISLVADEAGIYTADLPAGNFLLTHIGSSSHNFPLVPGWYSDAGYDGRTGRGILFPIEAGKLTSIEVRLSQLVIGVLNEAGRAVRGDDHPGWSAQVCVQAPAATLDDADRCVSSPIDRRGAATFYAVQGEYQVRVLDGAGCYWSFPVSVGTDASVQELVSITSATPDTCE